MTCPPGAETVTVHRASRDRLGDRKAPTVPHLVEGCVIAPGGSSESTDRGLTVATTATLYAPFGADIRPDDVIEAVSGRWHVLGEPDRWRDPFQSQEVGMQVRLERVRG